jgi:hypothetical protein
LIHEEPNPIMINNKLLNDILPTKWELIDEYTIVAPILSKNDWVALKNKAKKNDMFEDFINHKL